MIPLMAPGKGLASVPLLAEVRRRDYLKKFILIFESVFSPCLAKCL
jgi:hypothetical protein